MYEEVLSIDLGDKDDLYRICRGKRVVYVSIQAPSIIPPQDKTESSKALTHMRKVPKWDQDWQTLTVAKRDDEMLCFENLFLPHRLPKNALLVPCHENFNIMNLQPVKRISHRVSLARQDRNLYCVKIARFNHELVYMKREVWAYKMLVKSGLTIAPKFHGYVYEEHPDRIIGFLMEIIDGRHADVEDLEPCRKVVQQMHGLGLIHGDLNKYNFIVTENGVKLVDFEASEFADEGTREHELDGLAGYLASTLLNGCYD